MSALSQEGADWPHLVWNGAEYGLAWRQQSDKGGAIYLARLAANGTLQGVPVQVASHPTRIYPPRLAWDGSGYAVAWIDSSAGPDQVYLARFSPPGERLAATMQASRLPGAKAFLRLAWNGDNYALCWQRLTGMRDWYFVTVPRDELPGEEFEVGSSLDSHGRLDVAACGRDFGVVFGQYQDRDDSGHLRFVHLSGEGTVLERTMLGAAEDPFPSLTSDGQDFAVAWVFDGMLRLLRFPPPGQESGGVGATISQRGRPGEPSLAWNGAGYGLAWVWTSRESYAPQIRFASLNESLAKIGPEMTVVVGHESALAPSLAWNGAGYGLAWQTAGEGGSAVHFASLDATGNILGTEVRIG